MKTKHLIRLLLAQPTLCGALLAAPFDCGSTGAFGPMIITNSTTLVLPPDGIIHCTTITISGAGTLKFERNALNTPVYLLATGDVLIEGSIDVSGSYGIGNAPGLGGPGGFDGGYGGSWYAGQSEGGRGLGPGGGNDNGFATFTTYGNLLLVPLIGGSGGAGTSGTPGPGGSGGGGALLIASNTRIVVSGSLVSIAGSGCNTPVGSGGAIRLVSPVVTGAGLITVEGVPACHMGGNPGRIRIDCQDHRAYLSLTVRGLASRGNRMFVFPAVIPSLDIIELAGQSIPEGTNNAVQLELPEGASTNQTVRVQARNYTNDVPIRVVVTPRSGPSAQFDAIISQASGNPPSINVPVVIPAGSISQIHVWNR
jgi:hypothetical protein